MRKFRHLTVLLLILSSYSCRDDADDEWDKKESATPLPSVVMEARSFFEGYVADAELSDQALGLYPGNFAPDWEKAVVTTDTSYVCVNVPIVSEVTYEGSFASRYDSIKGALQEAYNTAIGQNDCCEKSGDRRI